MENDQKEVILKKIHIKNFKSYKDSEIDLKNFNVVIGPNSSGKSNLIELFKLLKSIYTESYTIDPFLPWWGYHNVVWQRDETHPISVVFYLNAYGYDAVYETVFTGQGGYFRFIKEKLVINDVLTVHRQGETVSIQHNKSFINKIWRSYTKKSLHEPFFFSKEFAETLKQKDYYYNIQLKNVISDTETVLSFLSKNKYLSTYFDTDKIVVDFFLGTEEEQKKNWAAAISPLKGKIFIKNHKQYRMASVLYAVVNWYEEFLSNIIVLRPISAREIKKNILVARKEEELTEDALNLQSVLYNMFLTENKLPERIRSAMNYVFPGTNIRFELTSDARLYLKVNEQGLELDPPMISDGFYKFLAIMTALEKNASLLLIDEIENSLHPKAIERIIDELKDSNYPIIITTHSPAVIDIVDPKDIILLEKDPIDGSKATRIKDPEEVKRKLTDLGITLSEGWLYGKL